MPTLLRIGPFRFHFYSDEGIEPPHVHVRNGDAECKYWLSPIQLATNRGYGPHDLRTIERLVFTHQAFFIAKFHEFHRR
jgi:hypothetical protein